METTPSWHTVGREWFWILTCFALVVSPFGCQLRDGSIIDIFAGDGSFEQGLFINDGDNGPLIVAGQTADGAAFFVYGTRNEDGGLDEVESIVVRGSDGTESFITFESGRPVHVQGTGGSYAHIRYEQVSSARLTAAVELYDAETGATEQYDVDVDLDQLATQVADLVRNATGLELAATSVVDGTLMSKDTNQRVRITILSPMFLLFVVPLVAVVGLTSVILGQVLAAVHAIVVATVRATLLAVFAPLFLLAGILAQVTVRVYLTPLSEIFDALPDEPIVILT